MDTAQWPQEIVVKPMEEIIVQNTTNLCNNPTKASTNSSSLERKIRPQKESAINCPRCNSTNTKFCYYNNYSLSQPRYFCKTCRRYWTEGGSLRNVPVGGGSRKNKRSSSSSSSSSSSMSKKLPDLVVPCAPTVVLSQNPRMHNLDHGQDLNLGFPSNNDFKTISDLIQVPNYEITKNTNSSALELLNGITTRGMMNSFMPEFKIPVPEFKIPSLNFSLDGMGGNGGGATYGGSLHESSNGRLLFPFEDLKTTTHDHDHHVEQNRDQNGDSNGFWNGMLGGGSW